MSLLCPSPENTVTEEKHYSPGLTAQGTSTEAFPSKEKPVQTQQDAAPSPRPFFNLRPAWDLSWAVSSYQDSKIFIKLILGTHVRIAYRVWHLLRKLSHIKSLVSGRNYIWNICCYHKVLVLFQEETILKRSALHKELPILPYAHSKELLWKLPLTCEGKTAFDLLKEVQ